MGLYFHSVAVQGIDAALVKADFFFARAPLIENKIEQRIQNTKVASAKVAFDTVQLLFLRIYYPKMTVTVTVLKFGWITITVTVLAPAVAPSFPLTPNYSPFAIAYLPKLYFSELIRRKFTDTDTDL